MNTQEPKPDGGRKPITEQEAEDTPIERRGCLASIEHGIYMALRLPVFVFLVIFRRIAGR